MVHMRKYPLSTNFSPLLSLLPLSNFNIFSPPLLLILFSPPPLFSLFLSSPSSGRWRASAGSEISSGSAADKEVAVCGRCRCHRGSGDGTTWQWQRAWATSADTLPPLESSSGDPPRADLAAAALSNLDMVAAAFPSPDQASPPIPARICQRWLWEEDDNFGDDGRTNTTAAATTIGF